MLDFKRKIIKIDGWLTEAEGNFLYDTAKTVEVKNVIVEIGSWKGKSTICLGRGVSENKGVKIYAIDPHSGFLKLQRVFNNGIDTYQEFIKNIKNAGIDQFVEPIRKTSEEASKNFQKSIGFLFIDGAHEYNFVNLDY